MTTGPAHNATTPSTASPATGEVGLSKAFDPKSVESVVTQKWAESRAFHPDPKRVLSGEKKPYSVVIPPPNVTGALHLGHALNNTIQDILVRAHRMKGFETLWMPGTDHAGIATQAVVEKRLRKEGKLKGPLKDAMTREEFVAQVQLWKDEYEQRITDQLKAMGCSCDFERQRFTMDEICAKGVREAFFVLFRDGLIVRGKRLVNWDTVLQTAVADDECTDEEVDTSFWYLRYPLTAPVKFADGTTIDHVTVATTRPETYLGDTAVAMNPKDPRAAALNGAMVKLPLVGRTIPIVVDEYVVLPAAMATTEDEKNDPKAAFATGFLKVTPAHDPNDYDIGQRHGLAMVNMMSPDGRVSDKHGWTDIGEAREFVGLKMAEARKAVVAKFKELGLLEDIRPHKHSVKVSERSSAVIEPYLSDQWYVKVTDERMAKAANRAIAGPDPQMTFHPARYAKTFQQWHDNIRDWCISRQLWWGHQIPVWFVAPNLAVNHYAGIDLHIARAQIVDDIRQNLVRVFGSDIHISDQTAYGALPSGWTGSQSDTQCPILMVTARTEAAGLRLDALAVGVSYAFNENWWSSVRKTLGSDVAQELIGAGSKISRVERDPDVLDTWFSSALWPLSTMGWPDPAQSPQTAGLLAAFNPTSVLSTAREIITLWVSRMTMMNRYFLGAGQGNGPVPFKDVFIHAVVQDGDGRKMSKSLGNGVDPLDIIASHGADAMRFTLCHMTTNTQDVRMPVVKDSKTGANTSPKFDLGRNFCNKLWNAARFTLSILAKSPALDAGATVRASELSLLDRWMLSRLAQSVAACDAALAGYEFSDYAETVYKLLWWDFCDWYLEGVKPTAETSPAQRAVLLATLTTIVRLLHPVTPFVTEALHEQLKNLPMPKIEGLNLGAPEASAGLVCVAPWPVVSNALVDGAADAAFERLRGFITQLRTLRAEHNVAPKRIVHLHAAGPAAALVAELRGLCPGLIESLAGVSVETSSVPGGSASVITRFEGVEMALANLADAVDAGVERERLGKQLEQLRKSAATISGRLSNPGYADRAPPKLVEDSKAQLAKLEAEIAAIESRLKGL